MSASWKKLGQLYVPTKTERHPKLLSHAANPLPVRLEGDIYRIYFSGRDVYNRSSVGAVDVDIAKRKVVTEHYQPFFEHGPKNSFFADGVSIGNCYTVGETQYMLFMGWQNPASGHWRGDIGRLIVRSDLNIQLDSEIPLMSSEDTDPLSLSYPWVMPNYDGGYSMWYGSTKAWDAGNGEMLHVINYASSDDGHHWTRQGLAIPYELGKAQAFSRPTVHKSVSGCYEMWFSYRSGNGETYRIGYAVSKEGSSWELALNDCCIEVSPSGWDSEMIEYPFVFDHDDRRYMLYNGNGYGKTGFGLAELVHE